MTATYSATIQARTADAPSVTVNTFSLIESYSGGWYGSLDIVSRRASGSYITLGGMLAGILAADIAPGNVANLSLIASGGDAGGVVRNWPLLITRVFPEEMQSPRQKRCRVEFLDPVSALFSREIWGVFREHSVGEVLGGALSIAAGAGGTPSLNPVLPGMPMLNIHENVRPSLQEIPYVIASGEALANWSDRVLGLLGVRYELVGRQDGGLDMYLADGELTSEPVNMRLIDDNGDGDGAGSPGANVGRVETISYASQAAYRSILLDDVLYGPSRQLGSQGSVDSVIDAPGMTVDEARLRSRFKYARSIIDALQLVIQSEQFDFRPGQLVELEETVYGVARWQVSKAIHALKNGAYGNSATLLRGSLVWYPSVPPRTSPVMVTGVAAEDVVGEAYREEDIRDGDPVARDYIGRVHVFFPFTPVGLATPEQLEAFGSAFEDGAVTWQDFTEEERAVFQADQLRLEADFAAYENGDLADPFPGQSDDELSVRELEDRHDLFEKRVEMERYRLYRDLPENRRQRGVPADEAEEGQLPGEDYNQDGYRTALDDFRNTESYALIAREFVETGVIANADATDEEILQAMEDNRGKFLNYEQTWGNRIAAYHNDGDQVVEDVLFRYEAMWLDTYQGLLDSSVVGATPETKLLLENLAEIKRGEEQEDGMTEEEVQQAIWDSLSSIDKHRVRTSMEAELVAAEAFLEAYREYESAFDDTRAAVEEAIQQDVEHGPPPRIPLRVITRSAGPMGGFISPHRKGDVCRVAIHNPLLAEVVGFEYREGSSILADFNEYLEAMLVARSSVTVDSWSGIACRDVSLDDFLEPREYGERSQYVEESMEFEFWLLGKSEGRRTS